MPIIIIDGPEKAGKSTLIKNLALPSVDVTHWGPVDSVYEYFVPLKQAIDRSSTGEWIIWDRSWASEWVYNDLLNRRSNVESAFQLLEDMCDQHGVIRLGVLAPQEVLEKRRTPDDHDVEPQNELYTYQQYFKYHDWIEFNHILGED